MFKWFFTYLYPDFGDYTPRGQDIQTATESTEDFLAIIAIKYPPTISPFTGSTPKRLRATISHESIQPFGFKQVVLNIGDQNG